MSAAVSSGGDREFSSFSWRIQIPPTTASALVAYLLDSVVILGIMVVEPMNAARQRRIWLYPISRVAGKEGSVFRLQNGKKVPVSVPAFREWVIEKGMLHPEEAWHIAYNFEEVAEGDEVYIYCGDGGAGLIGVGTVTAKYTRPRAQYVHLNIDRNRSRALLAVPAPVPASEVRKWFQPRFTVRDLGPYRAQLRQVLPWGPGKVGTSMTAARLGRGGAGFGDAATNRKVERAAVAVVTRWYESKGWTVTSVESEGAGFDLLCQKHAVLRRVEVKGVAGTEPSFLITRGELEAAKRDQSFVLHVVVKARTNPEILTWSAKRMLETFEFRPIQYVARLAQ